MALIGPWRLSPYTTEVATPVRPSSLTVPSTVTTMPTLSMPALVVAPLSSTTAWSVLNSMPLTKMEPRAEIGPTLMVPVPPIPPLATLSSPSVLPLQEARVKRARSARAQKLIFPTAVSSQPESLRQFVAVASGILWPCLVMLMKILLKIIDTYAYSFSARPLLVRIKIAIMCRQPAIKFLQQLLSLAGADLTKFRHNLGRDVIVE